MIKRARGESGGALVETAIAMPVILLVIFAAFQLVLLLNIKTLADHAAYEAARTAAVRKESGRAARRAKTVMRVLPYGPGFLAGPPRVKVTRDGGQVRAGVTARVLLLPFFDQVAKLGGSGGAIEVSAEAVAVAEPWSGFE